jgi:hypothetical protein
MRIRRVLGVALVGLLLAGCATATSSTDKAISVDGGALVIAPVKSQPVIYGKQAALFDLEHSQPLGDGWSLKDIDFGYVTIKHTIAGGAVATPERRLAWVLFYNPGGFISSGPAPTCPGGQQPRASKSGAAAMIVDAVNETSFFYTGVGTTNCGIATKPVVRYATQVLSVPWVDLGGDLVRATFPGCTTGGIGEPMDVVNTVKGREVRLAILGYRRIGPCALPPISKVMDLGLTAELKRAFPRPWSHPPVGPMANGALSV